MSHVCDFSTIFVGLGLLFVDSFHALSSMHLLFLSILIPIGSYVQSVSQSRHLRSSPSIPYSRLVPGICLHIMSSPRHLPLCVSLILQLIAKSIKPTHPLLPICISFPLQLARKRTSASKPFGQFRYCPLGKPGWAQVRLPHLLISTRQPNGPVEPKSTNVDFIFHIARIHGLLADKYAQLYHYYYSYYYYSTVLEFKSHMAGIHGHIAGNSTSPESIFHIAGIHISHSWDTGNIDRDPTQLKSICHIAGIQNSTWLEYKPIQLAIPHNWNKYPKQLELKFHIAGIQGPTVGNSTQLEYMDILLAIPHRWNQSSA